MQRVKAAYFSDSKDQHNKNETMLLTVLIEKWDAEHNGFATSDTVQLLQSFMNDHNIKQKDLVCILGISKAIFLIFCIIKKAYPKK